MNEAESAITRLCSLVERLSAISQEMSLRLTNMGKKIIMGTRPAGAGAAVDDNVSTISNRTVSPAPDNAMHEVHRNQFDFASEDLLASRVCRKPL